MRETNGQPGPLSQSRAPPGGWTRYDRRMSENSGGSGFFGFINILEGLTVVPKIIMFVGLLALIAGFFSGPFSVLSNVKIASGAALMSASLGWRDWENGRWSNPNPPYEGHWDFVRCIRGLIFFVAAAWLFHVAYQISARPHERTPNVEQSGRPARQLKDRTPIRRAMGNAQTL
jgi:hypothetical protein